MSEKPCRKCCVVQPISEYHKNHTNTSGLSNFCKPCTRKVERSNRIKRLYGIDDKDYEAMFDRQHGVCAICKQESKDPKTGQSVRLDIDHCHVSGKIRGLLCRWCNFSIGHLRDLSTILEAARYLEVNG